MPWRNRNKRYPNHQKWPCKRKENTGPIRIKTNPIHLPYDLTQRITKQTERKWKWFDLRGEREREPTEESKPNVSSGSSDKATCEFHLLRGCIPLLSSSFIFVNPEIDFVRSVLFWGVCRRFVVYNFDNHNFSL